MGDARSAPSPRPQTESRPVERALSAFLRVVLAAAVCLGLAGGVYYLVQHGSQPVAFDVFQPLPEELRNPEDILSGAMTGGASELIQLAVLLLLLTPPARELLAVGLLARRREWTFVAVGLASVLVMSYGLLFGS